MDGEYRVVTDGVTYWVQYVSEGKLGHFGPSGEDSMRLLEDWRQFNTALHKPVLSASDCKEYGPPLVGRHVRAVSSNDAK